MMATLRLWLWVPALVLSACGEPAEPITLSDPGEASVAGLDAEPAESVSFAVASSRDALRIVGSSTVFPLVTTVAENFGARSGFPTPVVEQTGTGGGMNLFCTGVGLTHPDFTAASRRMEPSEFQLCQDNGVTDIVEIPIGFDGIVLGNSIDAEAMDISKADLFLALADRIPMPVDADGTPLLTRDGELRDEASFSQVAGHDCSTFVENPYARWSDVNPELPAFRIQVFGPPPTSGTRDAFVELDMVEGARQIGCMVALEIEVPSMFGEIAARIREDGAWVDSGENDNAVVQTLTNAPGSFGIFGYSFLEQNEDRIQASRLDGVEPSYETISNGLYPGSRSLFLYAKAQHVGLKAGLQAFIEELTHPDVSGRYGYLADRGLIALPEERRLQIAQASRNLEPMGVPD